MGEVLQFPLKPLRDWLAIESTLYDELARHDFSEEISSRIICQMKSFYEQLDPHFSFSFGVKLPRTLSPEQGSAIRENLEEAVTDAAEQVFQNFMNRIFVERLEREIAICREMGWL